LATRILKRSDVHESDDARAVWPRNNHLLIAHRLAIAQNIGHWALCVWQVSAIRSVQAKRTAKALGEVAKLRHPSPKLDGPLVTMEMSPSLSQT
jgi:hypothetical protein